MERRKVTFKLHLSDREAERLTAWVRLHCQLYNAALRECIEAHTPGTGVAARPEPLARQRAKSTSVTCEIPATTTQGV